MGARRAAAISTNVLMLDAIMKGGRSWLVNEVKILAYHRILDMEGDRYPFDERLISARKKDFEWQISYLASNCKVISLEKIAQCIRKNEPFPRNAVVLTFDDGFDDFYYSAYPILRSYRMPASLFLATDYIGQERTFWYDWLAYVIYADRLKTLDTGCHRFGAVRLSDDRRSRYRIVRDLGLYLMNIPNRQRIDILEHIENKHGWVYWDEDEDVLKLSRPISWDQLREVSNDGLISCHSHTRTHPILTQLKDDELEQELKGSRSVIQRELAEPSDIIAYPVGRGFAIDDRVKEAAKGAGYSAGISFTPGVNRWRRSDPFGLRRIGIDLSVDRSVFRSLLAIPELFAQ